MPSSKQHEDKARRDQADHAPGGSPSTNTPDRSRDANADADERKEGTSHSKSGHQPGQQDDRKGESSKHHPGGRSR